MSAANERAKLHLAAAIELDARPRRRALPSIHGLLGACIGGVLLCGVLLGCSEQEPEPVRAARAFAAAIQASSYGGDVEHLLPLLERKTVERLQQAAERASDQVGGRRSVEPQEMLQVVDVEPSFQVASAELLEGDATQARVKLVGADGNEHVLQLFHEDGAWRVRIPLPPVTSASNS